MDVKTLSEVIETAIEREQAAYDFYKNMIEKVDDLDLKDTLAWIAAEEKKHKAFLVEYRRRGMDPGRLSMRTVIDYHIAEHLDEPDIEPGVGSAEVYLAASHRELKSYRFYSGLAAVHPEGNIQDLLLAMASEELKHKEKMEYLYTNTAFPQTEGG